MESYQLRFRAHSADPPSRGGALDQAFKRTHFELLAPLLRAGIELHRLGRLEEAEAAYGMALNREPRSADAWHLMARAALDRGQPRPAAIRAVQAIRLNPGVPAFHNTLGEILLAQGQTAEALACHREALRIDPRFVPALVNLGNALQSAGDLAGASISYGKAIEVRPDCAEAFTNLGNVLRAQARLDEAIACYREAVQLCPTSAEAFVNLAAGLLACGRFAEAETAARRAAELKARMPEAFSNLSIALLNLARFEEAEEAARRAIECVPQAAHLHVNLASILLRRRRFQDAETACRRAIELCPQNAEAANNLGIALQKQDRLEDAARALESAVAQLPLYSEAWTNLGTVRESQNRPDEALACYDRAIAAHPDFPKAHFCRALTLLRSGRLDEGFAEYEWRWKARNEAPRAQSLPAWDGSNANGKTVLLYAEQGLGDTIQFARFARLAAGRGTRVVLECQPPLLSLAARIDGVAQVVSAEDPLPVCDAQAALMSLPHLLQSPLETGAYLSARQPDVDTLHEALGPQTRPRIGLAWAGNPDHASDRRRSIPIETLARLAAEPLEWVSLQKGPVAADWLRQPLSAGSGLEELAALMSCLDLIVTVDSMPAHLAGALGRPVWILLSHVPDWRWQMNRVDSPWYANAWLFRQEEAGNWEPVLDRVTSALRSSCFKGSCSRPICTVEAGHALRPRRSVAAAADAANPIQDVNDVSFDSNQRKLAGGSGKPAGQQ